MIEIFLEIRLTQLQIHDKHWGKKNDSNNIKMNL